MESFVLLLSLEDLAAVRCTCKNWKQQLSLAMNELHIALPLSERDMKQCLDSFPLIKSLHLKVQANHGLGSRQVKERLWGIAALEKLSKLGLTGCSNPWVRETLTLNKCSLDTMKIITPSLQWLELEGFQINSLEFCNFIFLSSRLKVLQMRHILFTWNSCDPHDGFCIWQALTSLKKLQRLELRHLSSVLADKSHLKKLAFPSELETVAAKAIGSLENLVDIRLEGDDFVLNKGICDAICSLPDVRVLEIRRECVRNDLSPSYQMKPLVDSSIVQLRLLKGSLRHLSLGGYCNFTSKSLDAIACIRELETLKLHVDWHSRTREIDQMDLHHINSSSVGAVWKKQDLQKLYPLQNLKDLSISFWDLDTDQKNSSILTAFQQLTGLELSCCPSLDDKIFYELAMMPKLQKLAVSQCPNLSDIGISVIARGKIHAYLRTLKLTGSHKNITDLAISALRPFRHLQELDLSSCERLTDIGVAELATHLTNIRNLNLSDCFVTDAGCNSLSRGCPHLETLSVEYCSRVTDQSICCLKNLKNLRKLYGFGSGITKSGASELRHSIGAEVFLVRNCWWSSKSSAAAAELSRLSP